MNEIFKEVEHYKDYSVSNKGNVKSIKSNIILKPYISKGYYCVVLCTNGITIAKKIYRLAAEAFIPNPYNKPQINHKDGNKLNDNIDNLEWCTAKENMEHAVRTGLVGKIPKEIVIDIYILSKYTTATDPKLSKLFNIFESTIFSIRHGNRFQSITKDIKKIDKTIIKDLISKYKLQNVYYLKESTPFNCDRVNNILTADKAYDIFILIQVKRYKQDTIAKCFNVSRATIGKIVNKITWKDVTNTILLSNINDDIVKSIVSKYNL